MKCGGHNFPIEIALNWHSVPIIVQKTQSTIKGGGKREEEGRRRAWRGREREGEEDRKEKGEGEQERVRNRLISVVAPSLAGPDVQIGKVERQSHNNFMRFGDNEIFLSFFFLFSFKSEMKQMRPFNKMTNEFVYEHLHNQLFVIVAVAIIASILQCSIPFTCVSRHSLTEEPFDIKFC